MATMYLVLCSLILILSSSVFVSSQGLYRHNSSFVPDYVLRVTYQNAQAACRTKPLALVNGTSPGPILSLREGQTTWIRVHNDMPSDNLTMHWHGLSQAAAPFSDGTPQASQWPIKTGHYFDYEIRPAIGEAGTYFYHSHVEFQAVSVAGPLIVTEASGQPPYNYDEEKTMFISEFYNMTQDAVVDALTSANFAWTGETEALLVNGQSYAAVSGVESQAPPQFMYNQSLVRACGPEVFEVEPGKTYRFRSIGGLALSIVSFAFESHDNISIIAADGSYTKPTMTDHMQISPGQRFDFLLHAKTQQELTKLNRSTFWIQFETRFRPTNVTSYAILKYKNSNATSQRVPASPPSSQPLTLSPDIQHWLEYTLQPLKPNGFPAASEVSRRVYLSSSQHQTRSGIFWSVNNRTWTEADEHFNATAYNDTRSSVGVPYLVNIYQRGEAAIPNYNVAVQKYGGWDPTLNVYAAKVGEVVEIILHNQPNGQLGGFDPHPWHIHGAHIYDIGSGPGTYDHVANEKKLQGYNPVKRDTTLLYKYVQDDDTSAPEYSNQGWRAWRLRVLDAGVWMVHCHVLQHMIMGMQSVWVMGNASQITKQSQPYVQGYLAFGGDAYGNATYDPLVYHHYG